MEEIERCEGFECCNSLTPRFKPKPYSRYVFLPYNAHHAWDMKWIGSTGLRTYTCLVYAPKDVVKRDHKPAPVEAATVPLVTEGG